MWDVDFLVPEESYEEAIHAALDLGFSINKDVPLQDHSTDLHKGAATIDIHRLFAKGIGYNDTIVNEMFFNAKSTTAFGIEVLVPRQEDLLLITMANAYHNFMVNPGNYHGEFFYFFDIANIVKDPSFDWNIVIKTASKIGILHQIWALLQLFDGLLPNILPAGLFDKMYLVENEKKLDHSVKKNILANEKRKLFYLREYYECRTFKDVLSYLKLRINYRCLWSIQRISLVRFLFLDIFIKFYKVNVVEEK
jgi:hypothetical protein